MDARILVGLTLVLLLFFWSRNSKGPLSAPYPPGPKPLPVLGNVLDLSPKELWLKATTWAKQYGGVCYLHILGQGIVFVNSLETAVNLMDKRGAIYSDKPHFVMAGELCGCQDMVAFTKYGEQSRRQRKLLTHALGVPAIRTYHPMIEAETQSFLRRLIANPSDYQGQIRRYAGTLTLSVSYGYEVRSNEDHFLRMAEDCVSLLANRIASGGGLWPVDIFPSLKHLPLWFPGAGFKRNAMKWKAQFQEWVDQPFNYTKNAVNAGTAPPSFCSTLLEKDNKEVNEQQEFDLKWAANSIYGGSIDSTIAAVSLFIIAIMLHPEVMIKAQKEIDTVVGPDRLPTFRDRESLPYLECVMAECLRWGAPVPLGLPHKLTEDDVYEGMFIPRGSLIFSNIWAMTRDESIYPNPESFLPERFMDIDEQTRKSRDPRNYVFGFGRRRCPGSNLAESSIWLLITSMLATLSISKAVDEFGHVIEPEVVFENSIFRTPNKFKCDIRPRSEQVLRVLGQIE